MRRRALYFIAPYQVAVREEPLPSPAADQVVVETVVSAISAGTELLVYRGQVPTDMPVDETIAALAGDFCFPLKYGYAAVGRVIAVGSSVAADWLGRVVCAFHPHESHFLAVPTDLMPIPPTVTAETATFLPNMETAVNLLMDGEPLIGEGVVVVGQGVVGMLTTALLARLPLASLITLDRYALRREKSIALGAHASVDPEALDLHACLPALFPAGASSPGADLTYELSGDPAALNQAIALTGFGGRVVIGSWYGQKRAALHLGGRFHRSRIRVISSQVSTIAPQWTGRWTKARRLQVAWRMLEQVQPAHLITHRFPIEQAAHAYALLAQTPQEALHVLLTYQ